MFTSAIEKQTCLLFYFIESIYGISNLEIWNHGKKEEKKESNSIVSFNIMLMSAA